MTFHNLTRLIPIILLTLPARGQTFNLIVPATNSTFTDSSNTYTLSIPSPTVIGTLTLSSLTPDGTIILHTSTNHLTNADGTWGFSQPLDSTGCCHQLTHNNTPTGWSGRQLEISNGGKVYFQGVTSWWIWNNNQFVQTTAPQ